MIKSFLNQMYQQMIDEKLEYEKEKVNIQNQMKETDKFIQILDEKNDPNFESFTPRNVNAKNKEKIKELKEVRRELERKQKEIQKKVSNTVNRTEEIKTMISQLNEKKNQVIAMSENINEKKRRKNRLLEYVAKNIIKDSNSGFGTADSFQSVELENKNILMNKLEFIKKIIEIDCNRAKLELGKLVTELKKQPKNIENQKNNEAFSGYIDVPLKYYDFKMDCDKKIACDSENRAKVINYILEYMIEKINQMSEIERLEISVYETFIQFNCQVINKTDKQPQNIFVNDDEIEALTYLTNIGIEETYANEDTYKINVYIL